MQALIDRYDGEIAYTDWLVEKFVTGLKSLGPEPEPPLIILVGDHGESLNELWERFRVAFAHGQSLPQGQLKVPLLLWWPGRIPGGTVEASTTSLVDIAPTIFALLSGQGFPTQGVNLLPRLERSSFATTELDAPYGELAFSERRAKMRRDSRREGRLQPAEAQLYSVQDDRYKLTLMISGNQERIELYDLLLDPLEERDISQIDKVNCDRLLVEMREWLDATQVAETPDQIPEEKLRALKALGYLD